MIRSVLFGRHDPQIRDATLTTTAVCRPTNTHGPFPHIYRYTRSAITARATDIHTTQAPTRMTSSTNTPHYFNDAAMYASSWNRKQLATEGTRMRFISSDLLVRSTCSDYPKLLSLALCIASPRRDVLCAAASTDGIYPWSKMGHGEDESCMQINTAVLVALLLLPFMGPQTKNKFQPYGTGAIQKTRWPVTPRPGHRVTNVVYGRRVASLRLVLMWIITHT